MAARLRDQGHDIQEEFPIGRRRGDILDRTDNVWLELDRVERPLNRVGEFAARLAQEGATFRQPEVADLPCRKVLVMEYMGPVLVSSQGVRQAAEAWLADCHPGCAPDEIRISLSGHELVIKGQGPYPFDRDAPTNEPVADNADYSDQS